MKTAEELMKELRAAHPLASGTDNFKWLSWVCRALSGILLELDDIRKAIDEIKYEMKRDFGAGKKLGVK